MKGHPAVPAGLPSIGRLSETQQRDTPTSCPPPSACSLTSSLRPQLLESLRPGPRAEPSEQAAGQGRGNRGARAAAARTPHPRGPLGTVRCPPPRRLPACSPLRPRTVTEDTSRAGSILGVCWLYAHSLQTGKLRLRQGPGILALQPSQAQQPSPPTGDCTPVRS